MNYELAKELKEAGFPQTWREGTDFYWGLTKELEREACSDIGRDSDMRDSGIKVPSLLELIDACGEGRILIEKACDTAGLDIEWYWVAQRGMYKESGLTPEEAVARLYLVLNKK